MTENDGGVVAHDELLQNIADQIAMNSTAIAIADGTTEVAVDATAVFAEIEDDLKIAERFGSPRTSLGRLGRRIPFSGAFLRLLALVLRDQYHANAAMVRALRRSVALNVRLASELQHLRHTSETRGTTKSP